ncbi:MAG: DUF2029 domain-containing protein [Deltaproteobacteria bacterium]|nr:MAG: DUF2029 domain-containing protein [Deltaproteobacteria bacterium]
MRTPKLNWPWVREKLFFILPPLCLAIFLSMWASWIIAKSAYAPRSGHPIGPDFSYFWAAASLVLGGEPAAVYDFSRIHAVEMAYFGVDLNVPWPYPPSYLLLLLPFGLLPYLPSLVIWLSTTLAGYLVIIHRIAPNPRVVWFALVFPGAFQNLFFGQNGFLSSIFLGGGLLLLDRYPWLAGLLLSLLTYKPHLAVLVPLALVAGRRWQALLAMLAGTVALILATTLVLGPQVWTAFLNHIPKAMKILETGSLNLVHMMPTVFAAVQLSGAGVVSARILHTATMLAVVGLVAWTWRRESPSPLRNAMLVLGILMFSPHGYVYDLAILALPMAWLGWEGYTKGWLPGERVLLFLAWISPVALIWLAQATGVQLTPLVLMGLIFLVFRRALQGSPAPAWKMEIAV